MEVQPWHSAKAGDPYYHNNTRCRTAELIALHDLVPGTGERQLCPACGQLNREDEQQPTKPE
jgi:hypothetical protein